MLDDPKFENARLALARHGGNLNAAIETFPNAPLPWLDLSTGISPYPYPFTELPRDLYAKLPEPAALAALEKLAAKTFGAQEPACVIAGAGTQNFIQWLPFLLAPKKIGILGFTYSEYARAFAAFGSEVYVCEAVAELAHMDAALIVNPNNPDGRCVAARELCRLAETLSARGGVLIVDEAFGDMHETATSVAPVLPEFGGMVLRSFGKAYGLPGIRLGFAIGPPGLVSRLRGLLGPWPVAAPAIAIGREALADRGFLAASRKKLLNDVALLDELLAEAGFAAIGGTLLFRLVGHAEAEKKFQKLGAAGILVRPFSERPTWLRFGVPASDVLRRRLRGALLPR